MLTSINNPTYFLIAITKPMNKQNQFHKENGTTVFYATVRIKRMASPASSTIAIHISFSKCIGRGRYFSNWSTLSKDHKQTMPIFIIIKWMQCTQNESNMRIRTSFSGSNPSCLFRRYSSDYFWTENANLLSLYLHFAHTKIVLFFPTTYKPLPFDDCCFFYHWNKQKTEFLV